MPSDGLVASVIIPAWNVEAWVGACLDSVLGQSLAADRTEVIVVDDGSTDGTAAILDAYAERDPRVRVVHQPNSGGPGGPRNTGLALACGTYVMFVDADDCLGPEALERLVTMAERNGSDIVVPRAVGVGGRRAAAEAFHEDVDHAPIELVYGMLNVLKLFRRSFLERIGARFDEGMACGEDALFMERSYLEARVISVLGSYDAYFWRNRPGSQTTTTHVATQVQRLDRIRDRMELLAARRPPGPLRDRMMARHIADLVRPFHHGWAALDEAERRALFDATAPLVRRWNTRLIQARAVQWMRIRTWCLAHDRYEALVDIAAAKHSSVLRGVVVEGRRFYAPYPHFRDGAGIPDRCFEITAEIEPVHEATARVADGIATIEGTAFLAYLRGSASVVLHRMPAGPDIELETERRPSPGARDRYLKQEQAGFAACARVDPPSVPPGLYRVQLRLAAGQTVRTIVARADGRVREADRRSRGARGREGAWSADRPAFHADRAGTLYLAVPPVGRLGPVVARGLSAIRVGRRRIERRLALPA